MYASMYLFIVIVFSFKIAKVIPTLSGDYLRIGNDIYMIYNKDNTQKCGWSLSTGVESSGQVGQ